MSLTIEETSVLNAMPENLKDFAEAQMHRKVKDYNQTELKGKCLGIVVQFYKDTNTKNVDEKILASQRDELIRAFQGANKDLTIEEGRKAFEIGVAGQSGPYFGGCYKTYVQFLNYYRTRPERDRSIKMFIEQTKPAATAEKPLINWNLTNQGVINYFEHYKTTGKFEWEGNGAWRIYDILWKDLNLIKWTKEERTEIATEAETEYTEAIQKAMERQPKKAEEFKICLVTMASGENRTFDNLRKRIALKKWFDTLIKDNRSINDLIK